MIYCNNNSNCIHIANQTDLNSAVAEDGRCIHVDGGEDLVIGGNATVQEVRGNATVQEVRGNATVQRVGGNATVQEVWGNATVQRVWGKVEKAQGAAIVGLYGEGEVNAGPNVTVIVHGLRTKVVGGVVHQIPEIVTPTDWADFYGVPIVDGKQFKEELAGAEVVVLFKAVDDKWQANHNQFPYIPGTEPQAPDWDDGVKECGGGLHFSPQPFYARRFHSNATKFVGCPVRLADIVVHKEPQYPDKTKAPGVCAPVFEVTIDGERVEPASA
jgi:hypothetical protein